jgi:hypothetical protein
MNQEFMMYKNDVCNEGYVKMSNDNFFTEKDKFDWYVKPMKEGLDYNLTDEQSDNIH